MRTVRPSPSRRLQGSARAMEDASARNACTPYTETGKSGLLINKLRRVWRRGAKQVQWNAETQDMEVDSQESSRRLGCTPTWALYATLDVALVPSDPDGSPTTFEGEPSYFSPN